VSIVVVGRGFRSKGRWPAGAADVGARQSRDETLRCMRVTTRSAAAWSCSSPACGGDHAKVVYDGKTLAFPTWSSSQPVQQAERQAAWLAKWITGATAEPVQVAPVLALPGWYVDRKERGDVLVFSGRELRTHLLRARTAQSIAPEQGQRIVHQVEHRCRNVLPRFRPAVDAPK